MSDVERPTEEELQAYVDGRLGPERGSEIDAYLLTDPATAARIHSYSTSRQEIQEALRFKYKEPLPERLRVSAVKARLRQARATLYRLVATACFCLFSGFILGWYASNVRGLDIPVFGVSAEARSLKYDAVSAHRLLAASGPADRLLTAEESQLQRWMQRRVGESFGIPDLTGVGMRFLGGQILPYRRDNSVVVLLYGDDKGERVTIYLRAGDHGETQLRSTRLDDAQIYYWLDSHCAYVITAAPDLERISGIAEVVYEYFEGSGGKGERL